MIRTQIYLTEEIKQQLVVAAKRQRKPESQIIREILAEGLRRRDPRSAGDALLGLARLGEALRIKLPPDASSRIDDYLYGNEA